MLLTEIKKDVDYTQYQDFDSKAYLKEYYDGIIVDEQWLLEFLVEALKHVPKVDKVLDFGSGPVVSHLLPLAEKADEIHTAEYLETNRNELQLWLGNSPNAYNWSIFTQEILKLEGIEATTEIIKRREQQIRALTTRIFTCDAAKANPLGTMADQCYPLITMHFCAEGISLKKRDWIQYMDNILSLLAPNGQVILSSCGSNVASEVGTYYRSLDQYLPLTQLTPQEILTYFMDRNYSDIDLRVQQLPGEEDQGYDCLVFVRAKKPA